MQWLKWVAGALTLIGTVTSGWLFLDDRFAKAGETQQQIDGVKQLYLQSELRSVRREKFQIQVTKQTRKLTPIEEQRLQQLGQEEQDLNGQVQRIEQRRTP